MLTLELHRARNGEAKTVIPAANYEVAARAIGPS